MLSRGHLALLGAGHGAAGGGCSAGDRRRARAQDGVGRSSGSGRGNRCERCAPNARLGIRVRGSNRGADHADAFGAEHLVEGVAELRVSIADEKPEPRLVAELHHEVAGLLGDPAPVRVRRAGDVLAPPCFERDEEQHVDPLQECRFDGEGIACEHGRRLRAQERSLR